MQSYAQPKIAGTWTVDANSWGGEMVLTQDKGSISGTFLGDPIASGTIGKDGTLRFVRTGCNQIYHGKVKTASNGKLSISGTFDYSDDNQYYNWTAKLTKSTDPGSTKSKASAGTKLPAEFSGVWQISSGGPVGKSDEYKEYFKGTLTFAAGSSGATGIFHINQGDEKLEDIVFAGKTVKFTRPHPQYYQGELDKNGKIEGTFTHDGVRKRWWAVRPGSKTQTPAKNSSSAKVPSEFAGAWQISSGGIVGKSDQYKEYYKGTLTFTNGASGSTGIFHINLGDENLENIVFSGNTVKFTRPCVPQYYQGTLGKNGKIDGTFDHKGQKQRWWAVRPGSKTQTQSTTKGQPSVSGVWTVDANGWGGKLVLTQNGYTVSGSILDDPISDGRISADGIITFTRPSCGQKYKGKLSSSGGKMVLSGTFDDYYEWKATK